MNKQGGLTGERSQRSVFVGNIPYESSEDEMREIFSQIGPVISFRLVHDRESGKPKGYGFCEFLDIETAQSAMRNLNNIEFRGRTLRVDSATGEKSREELAALQAQMGPPPEESPYGPPVDPDKAPEAISRAVASLPPEQMFELMKQMKICVQNNPNEARNMLLQNPQLAYALLQAQVVMRIVDPQVAMAMLHRPDVQGPQLNPAAMAPPGAPLPPPGAGMPPPSGPPGSQAGAMPQPTGPGLPILGPHNPMLPAPPAGDIDYRQFPGGPPLPSQAGPPPPMAAAPTTTSAPTGLPLNINFGANMSDEQEKAQLIMQVLQLSDSQIASLPPEQRESVLTLKHQLNQGGPPTSA